MDGVSTIKCFLKTFMFFWFWVSNCYKLETAYVRVESRIATGTRVPPLLWQSTKPCFSYTYPRLRKTTPWWVYSCTLRRVPNHSAKWLHLEACLA